MWILLLLLLLLMLLLLPFQTNAKRMSARVLRISNERFSMINESGGHTNAATIGSGANTFRLELFLKKKYSIPFHESLPILSWPLVSLSIGFVVPPVPQLFTVALLHWFFIGLRSPLALCRVAIWFQYQTRPVSMNLVLLGFTGFYWVWLACTGFYWVLLGFS